MKLELLAIVSAALGDLTYGVAAQIDAQRAAGSIFGVDVPEYSDINVTSAAEDDRVAQGFAPVNLPALVVATGLSPARGGGEVSQGCREWPSVPIVVSWVESAADVAKAWAVSDYVEAAIMRAIAQALLDPARINIAGRAGGIQVETCNSVTNGPVMKALKDNSGVLVCAVSFDMHVMDYTPTLLT